MNLSRNWGRNFTLPLRMHKASTGWISASAVNECDWHYFHEREFSRAELSLKAASCVTVVGQSCNLQTVETHAEKRHRCGADEAFNASVSSNVYKAKTQNYTVSQKNICDREMCFILAELLWINLWSVSYQVCQVFSKCRKLYSSFEIPSLCLSSHVSAEKSGPWLRSPLKSQLKSL